MLGRTKFIVAGVLVVVAVVYLMVTSTADTARYFITVEELRAMGEGAVGRPITLSGAVLGDTIDYDAQEPRVTFAIVQVPGDPAAVEAAGGLSAVLEAAVADTDAPRVEVVYEGVKPDLLQHRSQAILRGELAEDGRFRADELLLKCPSRYEEGVVGEGED